MGLIQWDENIAVDIREIDNQHKKLVGIINTLFDAMVDARGLDVIDDTLKQLASYVTYHFTTEEEYFNQFEYTESEHHKNEHRIFFEQFQVIVKTYDEGKIRRDGSTKSITIEVWQLLKDWLVNHIQRSDRKYVSLFKDRGMK